MEEGEEEKELHGEEQYCVEEGEEDKDEGAEGGKGEHESEIDKYDPPSDPVNIDKNGTERSTWR